MKNPLSLCNDECLSSRLAMTQCEAKSVGIRLETTREIFQTMGHDNLQ